MRVLITVQGSRGDVEPLAALALRLREIGAQVRVCTPPDEEFTALITGVGAEHVPVGRSAKEIVARMKSGERLNPAEVAAEIAAAQFAALTPAIDGCDLLLGSGMVPAAAHTVADQAGVPYRFAGFIPGVLPSPHHPPLGRPGKPFPPDADIAAKWAIDTENLNALYAAPLNAHRTALGLPPVDDIRTHAYTDRPLLASDPILGPWTDHPGLRVFQTGSWILPDTRPLDPGLEGFLDAGDPPVFIGYGSMPVRDPAAAARTALAAVRANGRRAVLARGWSDLVPDALAADCFSTGEVNHQALFPRTAAVIHHGGAGTTHTAARSGNPQVVVPHMADQPYWAGRVEALGIGTALRDATPDLETLTAAIATALSPGTRARAAEIGPQIRTDGATVAARYLTESA